MIDLIKISKLESIKISLGLAAVLALVATILLGDVLVANWRADDTQILAHAFKHDVLANFFNPEIWRQLSPANLTPWVVASFEIDLFLFGLSPFGFYLHQLVGICLLAMACYMLLRLWLDRRFAFVAALLFMFGVPTTAVANNLMTRHYVEGLLFACIAVYFCVKYLRDGQSNHLVFSTVAYIAAVSAKEIFVPLVFLLPLLSEGPNRYRLKAFLVFLAVSAVYAMWRSFMLEGLIGGYTAPSQFLSADYLLTILRMLVDIPALLLGKYWSVLTGFYLAALALLLAGNRKAIIIVLGVLVLELLPLVPLASTPGISYPGRYYLLIWFTFSLSLGFCLRAIDNSLAELLPIIRRSGILLILFAILAAYLLISRQDFVSAIAATNAEFDVQAEFIWEAEDDVYFIPSSRLLETFWFVRGIRELKPFDRVNSTMPNVILDDMFLSPITQPLYEFNAACNCMQDVSETLENRIKAQQESIDSMGKLQVEMSFQNNVFKWNFGPYIDSDYYIFSDYLGVVRFPSQGEFMFYDIEGPLEVRVGHLPTDGLKTYSEPLLIEQDAAPVNWSN